MFKRASAAILLLLAITAGGCALGLAPPESFNDRAGYAIASHTAVLDTTTRALELGEISSSEAENVAAIADRARSLIDTARQIHAGGELDEADRTLGLALTLLQELQTYLRSKPS